jgi:hypothetical protein
LGRADHHMTEGKLVGSLRFDPPELPGSCFAGK